EFVGSPSMIDIEGVRILVYHGRSIDDLIAAIPGMDYPEPHKIMMELLKRRHLSPIYGSKVSIAPEKHDHYVIDEIPDILHCGHVHTVGVDMYKGVLVANTGAWQSQTDFQKRVNLMPDPAKAVMVDLGNMKTQILDFMHDDECEKFN
ncbi:MAG: DNA polymerase II small subunit, partial [Methanosarcinales archaeon]|nr:DNA polymerase II small subunit [Methanosarcinales archaeon]